MSSLSTTSSTFWRNIETVETAYRPDEPIFVDGRKVTNRAKDLRSEMFSSCARTEEFIINFFNKSLRRVLDLGCGIGANSLALAKQGTYVCGIDIDGDLLNKYLIKSKEIGCKSEDLRLRLCDLTKLETFKEYEKTFDLVVGVDILPYLPPKELRRTMEKIQDCITPKGYFVGTIFTPETFDPMMIEFSTKLGVHFYDGGLEFTKQLLENSGFEIKQLRVREEGGISFVARKT